MLVSGGARQLEPGQLGQPLGQAARVRVVVGEALAVVLERVQARRGEDAGLAHAAAEHLAEAVRARDAARAEPATTEPDRRAEPLREATRDGVERRAPAAPGRRRSPRPRSRGARRRGAGAARARARPRPRRRSCLDGKTRPPPRLCVFSTQTRRVRAKWSSAGLTAAAQLVGAERRRPRRSHGELHAGERRARARLVELDVRVARRDHLVARLGQRCAARSGWPSCPTARTAPPPCRAARRRAPAAGSPSGPRRRRRRRPRRAPSPRASPASAG